MVLLVRWILFALAIVFVAWLVPGIEVENFQSAMLVTVIIALINILTLGIFTLVINALLLMLAGYLAPGVDVEGFLSAFIGSVVLAFLGLIINMVTIDKAD